MELLICRAAADTGSLGYLKLAPTEHRILLLLLLPEKISLWCYGSVWRQEHGPRTATYITISVEYNIHKQWYQWLSLLHSVCSFPRLTTVLLTMATLKPTYFKFVSAC